MGQEQKRYLLGMITNHQAIVRLGLPQVYNDWVSVSR